MAKILTDEEIESYFNKNALEELLSIYQSTFTDIDYYEECLRNHVFDNIVSVRDALQVMGGLFMSMQKPFSIAETIMKNQKEKIYYDLKCVAIKEHKNFVSAPADREASYKVSVLRKIRNKFENKAAVCDRITGILQSLLSSIKKEVNMPQQG